MKNLVVALPAIQDVPKTVWLFVDGLGCAVGHREFFRQL